MSFTHSQATIHNVSLLIGLVGQSGSGKTYSALRLAAGMQRVVGGEVFGIDTEGTRMAHYADCFAFQRVGFSPPYSPDRYVEAIHYCIDHGAKVIVVDSVSHEHEGEGGVLDMHEAECERLAKGDPDKRERIKMLAWAKPKAARQRFVSLLQTISGVHLIFCFRSKEKIEMVKGAKQPKELGWQPVGGSELVYELTARALLLPGADGVPTWSSANEDERRTIKIPAPLRAIIANHQGPIDESLGEQFALWAAGDSVSKHRARIESCKNLDELRTVWQQVPARFAKDLSELKEERKKELQP